MKINNSPCGKQEQARASRSQRGRGSMTFSCCASRRPQRSSCTSVSRLTGSRNARSISTEPGPDSFANRYRRARARCHLAPTPGPLPPVPFPTHILLFSILSLPSSAVGGPRAPTSIAPDPRLFCFSCSCFLLVLYSCPRIFLYFSSRYIFPAFIKSVSKFPNVMFNSG